jgi:hypothetical protein
MVFVDPERMLDILPKELRIAGQRTDRPGSDFTLPPSRSSVAFPGELRVAGQKTDMPFREFTLPPSKTRSAYSEEARIKVYPKLQRSSPPPDASQTGSADDVFEEVPIRMPEQTAFPSVVDGGLDLELGRVANQPLQSSESEDAGVAAIRKKWTIAATAAKNKSSSSRTRPASPWDGKNTAMSAQERALKNVHRQADVQAAEARRNSVRGRFFGVAKDGEDEEDGVWLPPPPPPSPFMPAPRQQQMQPPDLEWGDDAF